jgi:hypothetical protein
MGMTLLWTVLCLAFAAMWLGRHWRELEMAGAPAGSWRGKWLAWTHGSAAWRRKLRERALPENAFQWLAEQDRRPVLAAWGFIGALAVLWVLGWVAWPRYLASPTSFFITALVMESGISWISVYAAARPIGTERRQGSLELLLTTPMMPEEIVEGQTRAVREQFWPVRMASLGICIVMTVGGFLTRHWTIPAIVSYMLIWMVFYVSCFLFGEEGVTRSMWTGLNTGRPMMAVIRRKKKNNFGWWWIIFMGNSLNVFWALATLRFPTGSEVEIIIVVVATILFFAFLIAKKFQPLTFKLRLLTEMRMIARMPLPDMNDPRLRKWTEEDQPPMAIYVQSFPERMAGRAGRTLGRQWGRWRTRRRR